MFAGVQLSFIKNIKIGDWILTNDIEGEIADIDLRVTTLKLSDNNYVFIPNRMIVDNSLKNYSLSTESFITVSCGVAYNSDLHQVENIVIDAVKNDYELYIKGSPIFFYYTEFADSSINFDVRVKTPASKTLEMNLAKGKLIKLIKMKFDQNNINIPFPIRTIIQEQ